MDRLTDVRHEDPVEVFEILEKIGQGSFGCVYKCRERATDKLVAIKVMEVDSDEVPTLQREIDILKACQSPGVVAYLGSYERDGLLWIVMEFCEAGSLCDIMEVCETCYTEDQIAAIMKMTVEALEFLHSKRKIHRDLKSGNILLSRRGECKLADFGVTGELTATMTKRGTQVGTPYWMPPEIIRNEPYDESADIWSLGITAIELAVGYPPHADLQPMRAIRLIPKSPPPELPDPEDWSDDFKFFVGACLKKKPQERLTAKQLLKMPFLQKAPGKGHMRKLVREVLPAIEQYRKEETEAAIEDDEIKTLQQPLGTVSLGSNRLADSSDDDDALDGQATMKRPVGPQHPVSTATRILDNSHNEGPKETKTPQYKKMLTEDKIDVNDRKNAGAMSKKISQLALSPTSTVNAESKKPAAKPAEKKPEPVEVASNGTVKMPKHKQGTENARKNYDVEALEKGTVIIRNGKSVADGDDVPAFERILLSEGNSTAKFQAAPSSGKKTKSHRTGSVEVQPPGDVSFITNYFARPPPKDNEFSVLLNPSGATMKHIPSLKDDKPSPRKSSPKAMPDASSTPVVTKFYSLKQLQTNHVGVDHAHREQYLSDDEFQMIFGLSKPQFAKMPRWKQNKAKRKHGLF